MPHCCCHELTRSMVQRLPFPRSAGARIAVEMLRATLAATFCQVKCVSRNRLAVLLRCRASSGWLITARIFAARSSTLAFAQSPNDLLRAIARGRSVLDYPRGLVIAEVRLAAVARGNHRDLKHHRFGKRQAEALATARSDHHRGALVQANKLFVGPRGTFDLDRRGIPRFLFKAR